MSESQITNRDLYEAQRATERQIGDLAVSVATLVAEWRGVGARLDSGGRRMNDIEARTRVLEHARWRAAGAASLAGTVAGGATGSLLAWLLAAHR